MVTLVTRNLYEEIDDLKKQLVDFEKASLSYADATNTTLASWGNEILLLSERQARTEVGTVVFCLLVILAVTLTTILR